jgi:hypothetical protein
MMSHDMVALSSVYLTYFGKRSRVPGNCHVGFPFLSRKSSLLTFAMHQLGTTPFFAEMMVLLLACTRLPFEKGIRQCSWRSNAN